ncbi:MAG: sigma-70 family RNA polymerase sigma factor [Polyangiaceae bacterium]|nr:sigma-70 family RNA polymerase sigma factor [Polyangiaceae bacterium]
MSRPNRPKITKELLERTIAGEFQAARECYAILQAIFRFRVVKVLAGNCSPETVEDLSHETFVALLDDDGRLIRAWDPERASFETYSGLIAEQRAVEYARKKKEELFLGNQASKLQEAAIDSSRWPDRIAASNELRQKVFTVLWEELDKQGRRVFELLYNERRNVKEICALMNMNEPAVYAWRSRFGRRIEEIAAMIGGEGWER